LKYLLQNLPFNQVNSTRQDFHLKHPHKSRSSKPAKTIIMKAAIDLSALHLCVWWP